MIRNPIKLMRYALAGWLPGGRRHCVMCERAIWRFMPYRGGSGNQPQLSQSLDMIGSDLDHFQCPRCGAHDRERHIFLYMKAGGLLDAVAGSRIIHFAPERHLSSRIRSLSPRSYTRCDLMPASEDIERVDMEDMPFEDGSFDLLIANHVLEHVHDLGRALGEIARVLAPGGRAILQTPYSTMLESTWSDPGIVSERARLHAYGQEDHVRLFGRDIFQLFTTTGMRSVVHTHQDALAGIDPDRYGVNPREPFFLFEKG